MKIKNENKKKNKNENKKLINYRLTRKYKTQHGKTEE